MLAEFEAFAVVDGVPAVAAADAIHFAVEIPAAVGVGIEKFVLAAVGFEVRDAEADVANGHAAREELREKVASREEQFALVIRGALQTKGLVRGEMVH